MRSEPIITQYATRIRPGLVVSTLVTADDAQTVTFMADPSQRSGANVVHTEHHRPADAKNAHQVNTVLARADAWSLTSELDEAIGARP